MKKLTNSNYLIYADVNYTHALNSRHLYNAPITLNIGEKHNRRKYILGAGNCDHIELWQEGIFIYVIAQNNGLQYISMEVFNIETEGENGEAGSIFLNEENYNLEGSICENILDIEGNEQIKILCEYL